MYIYYIFGTNLSEFHVLSESWYIMRALGEKEERSNAQNSSHMLVCPFPNSIIGDSSG